MDTRNQNRFTAARAAIVAHQNATGNTETDTEEAATDLLTDLCHWLHGEGVNVQRISALSLMHYRAEQAERDRPHQRWCIQETWLVHHCLTKDDSLRRYWTEQAARQLRNAPKEPQTFSEPLTDWEAARYRLATQLQREFEDGVCGEPGSVCATLVRSSMSKVDWFEIAESLLERAPTDK